MFFRRSLRIHERSCSERSSIEWYVRCQDALINFNYSYSQRALSIHQPKKDFLARLELVVVCNGTLHFIPVIMKNRWNDIIPEIASNYDQTKFSRLRSVSCPCAIRMRTTAGGHRRSDLIVRNHIHVLVGIYVVDMHIEKSQPVRRVPSVYSIGAAHDGFGCCCLIVIVIMSSSKWWYVVVPRLRWFHPKTAIPRGREREIER